MSRSTNGTIRVRLLSGASLLAGAGLVACSSILDTPNPYSGRAVTRPVRSGGSAAYGQVSAGFRHTCALAPDGAAYCWGANDTKQLGATNTGLRSCELYPCTEKAVAVSGGLRFTHVSSGTDRTCALTAVGKIYCWGQVAFSFEPGITRVSEMPVLVGGDSLFASMNVGGNFQCALTSGGVAMCWGNNDYGQIGDSTKTYRLEPVAVVRGLRFRSLSAGGAHACGVTLDGDAYCWGRNRYGGLGIGAVPYNSFTLARIFPGKVVGTLKWESVAAGADFTCAIAVGGAAHCWGANESAQQLGDDSFVTHRGVPGPVVGGKTFDALSASTVATCGHTPSNESYCWGSNYFGGLGNGEAVSGGVGHPVKTLGGPYLRVSAGGSHGCAVAVSGGAFCWGDAFHGQLGRD